MRIRTFTPLLLGLIFVFTALACKISSSEEQVIKATHELAAPSPTGAPSPAPSKTTGESAKTPGMVPAAPADEYPLTLQATGTKTDYTTSTKSECQADASAVLVIQTDGSAELTTTGPGFADHLNCTTSTDVTYILSGKANLASEIVMFDSCNDGNLSAGGTISYAGGSMMGVVSCKNKSGDLMTLIISP